MLACQVSHRWNQEGVSCRGFIGIILECLGKVQKASIIEERINLKRRNSYAVDFHLTCRFNFSLCLKEILSTARIICASVLSSHFLSNQAHLIASKLLNVFIREAVVVKQIPYFPKNIKIQIGQIGVGIDARNSCQAVRGLETIKELLLL